MSLGLLIDAFQGRTALVPALIMLVGRRNAWPRDHLSSVAVIRPSSAPPSGGSRRGPPAVVLWVLRHRMRRRAR